MHIPVYGMGAPNRAATAAEQSHYYAQDGQFGSGVATSGRSAELRAQAAAEMMEARNQFLAGTEELRTAYQAKLEDIVTRYRSLGVDPGRS